MSDLNDWVETLKRTVAPPGTFATFYPNTTDDDLAGSLMDGFGEAQLDTFFSVGYALDLDTGVITPDVEQAGLRLITLYSAVDILRANIMNIKTKVHYKAGTAEYEVDYSPNVLVAALKSLETAKDAIVKRQLTQSAAFAVNVVDQYLARATAPGLLWQGADNYGDVNYGDPNWVW